MTTYDEFIEVYEQEVNRESALYFQDQDLTIKTHNEYVLDEVLDD